MAGLVAATRRATLPPVSALVISGMLISGVKLVGLVAVFEMMSVRATGNMRMPRHG